MKKFKNFLRKIDNEVTANIMGYGVLYAIASIGTIIWLTRNPYYSEITVHTILATVILYFLYAIIYIPCVIYNNIMTNKENTIDAYNDVVEILGKETVDAAISDKKYFEKLLCNEIARRNEELNIIACQKDAESQLEGERLIEVTEKEDLLCSERRELRFMLNQIDYLRYVR